MDVHTKGRNSVETNEDSAVKCSEQAQLCIYRVYRPKFKTLHYLQESSSKFIYSSTIDNFTSENTKRTDFIDEVIIDEYSSCIILGNW